MVSELQLTPADEVEAAEDALWAVIMEKKRLKLEAIAEANRIAAERELHAEEAEREMLASERKKESGIQRDRIAVFTHLQRRCHFKIRLRELEERIACLLKEINFLDVSRSESTLLMKRLQLRQIQLHQERDRLRGYHGATVTSAVLHGADMKYEIHSFKRDIDAACLLCAK